ncbi:MAG: hypothetical protein OEP48_11900 [Betaproteobacteria bacterium]|nr:hypothetical protein [Betaproteobacteria bacterium]
MKIANPVSYPPRGDWDRRLSSVACPDLSPVTTLHENENVHCVSIDEAISLVVNGGLYLALPLAVIASYLFARSPKSPPRT